MNYEAVENFFKIFFVSFVDIYKKNYNREWVGWLIPFFLISAIVFYLKKGSDPKNILLLDYLKYAFPKKIYFARDLVIDFMSISITIVVFKYIFQFLYNFRINMYTFSSYLNYQPQNVQPSGLFINLIFSFAVFIGYELGWYLSHRLLHRVPFLWVFHKVHHSVVSMNPLTTSMRIHIVERLFTALIIYSFIGSILYFFRIFGYEPSVLKMAGGIEVFSAFFLLFALLRHSHIPLSFGKLNYLFISPTMHQIHHSSSPAHLDKNFGFYLSIFDVLFKTIYIPKQNEALHFGLSNEDNHPISYKRFFRLYFLEPFEKFLPYFKSK